MIRLQQTVRLHSIWGRKAGEGEGGGGCKGGMLCSFVWNQRDWIMLISATVVRCVFGICMHSICHSVSSVRGFTPVHSSHHCCHVSQLLLDAGWHACGLGARGRLKGMWCLHSQEAV